MKQQYRAGVPEDQRVDGWLYDADSGCLMGLASYELKARQPAGVPFMMTFSGCPHKVIIHKKREVISIPTVFV